VASIALFILITLSVVAILALRRMGGEADMAAIHLENWSSISAASRPSSRWTSRSATRNLWLCWAVRLRQIHDHEHHRGMESPSAGRVLFDGVDVSQTPMGKRGVGFVFQNYAIFTHMTVRQNLAYGLKMRRLPKTEIDSKVAKIAQLLQLEPYLDRPAAKLSVNILQRWRSAGPRQSILDLPARQPLSNVDAAFRAVMRTELKHLQREFGQTMVYVTHDQLEAMTMADRIAVMDHGLLQQVGSPLEVYNNPAIPSWPASSVRPA